MKTKSILFLFAVAVGINKPTITHAQVNVQDSLVLVDLYNSTDGPNWRHQPGWLTGPVQGWFGIYLSGDRVSGISLNTNRLKGEIPSSLGNLSSLGGLNLNGNQLSGSIPSSLGNLTNLVGLSLEHNQLSGEIPASIGNCTNLNYLQLDRNQLSGSIPSTLGNLTKLTLLHLDRNQLSGSIPSTLGNLTNLTEGFLQFNQLSGSIPSSLGNLSSLIQLNLKDNQLSGSIPSSLGNLSKLMGLQLSHNKLSGSIPSSLGKLSRLYYLYLYSNDLSGPIPSSLDSSNSISDLGLFSNKFTFAGLESFVITHPYVSLQYAPQKHIPLLQNGDTLSVHAGGTLSNNTYKWYKDGILVKTKTGNQKFITSGAGKYSVSVTNSIATALTLYSDTVTIPAFAAETNAVNKTNFRSFVYPNPANNIIYLHLDKPANVSTYVMLYNAQGTLMIKEQIPAGSLTRQYSSGKFTPGHYTLMIMQDERKMHEEQLMIVR